MKGIHSWNVEYVSACEKEGMSVCISVLGKIANGRLRLEESPWH